MGRSSLCAQQATAKANNVLIRLVSTYVQYAKMLHSIATRRTQQKCGSAIAEDKPANICANQSCKKGTAVHATQLEGIHPKSDIIDMQPAVHSEALTWAAALSQLSRQQ